MKKTLIALSFVCAGALAFADNPQYNDSWFSGIGTGATITDTAVDLKETNGSWSGLTVENASVKDGALELDLDVSDEGEAEEATFTVTDKASATEAYPVQRIVVSGVFTPIAAEDLLSGTAMAAKDAKVGFAIVNVCGETDTYKYYAWVGKASTAEDASAIADWEDLGAADDVTTAKTIVIGLDYSNSNADVVTATFAVGADEAEAKTLKEGGVALMDAALEKAKTDKVIASVSCTGSGTLSALQGKYQYAVAEVDGVKYETVEDAIAAAAKSKDGTVTVIRDLQDGDTVAAANGVTIKTGDGVTLSEDKVSTSDTTKEVKVVNGAVTVQTKTDILNAIEVGTAKKTNLAKTNEAKFRDFLNKHCGTAYRAAGTTPEAMTADIQAALAEKDSTSQRALWQSYALGVEPDAALKLTQVESDADPDGITLKFPGTPTDDFTIKYTVTYGSTSATSTEKGVVKVPLAKGHYKVTVSFE